MKPDLKDYIQKLGKLGKDRFILLEIQHSGCDFLDKVTVMGNKQNRSGIILQHILQCFFANEIHMVRRLIQNQKIRPHLKHLTQGKTYLFSSGKLSERLKYFFSGKKEAS